MPQLTYDQVRKYAKFCGHSLEKKNGEYILKTPYGTYHRKTLKEVDRKITEDHKRLSNARF